MQMKQGALNASSDGSTSLNALAQGTVIIPEPFGFFLAQDRPNVECSDVTRWRCIYSIGFVTLLDQQRHLSQ